MTKDIFRSSILVSLLEIYELISKEIKTVIFLIAR